MQRDDDGRDAFHCDVAEEAALDGERAEVEQWFISKFGEFRRPGGLAKATVGKPSVNLVNALCSNAAVLVKVPAAALGPETLQAKHKLLKIQRTLGRWQRSVPGVGKDEARPRRK